ncbi:MAG: NAD(P)H-hydrate dehydratase [Blastocatellia bacterium]|nr:NAD(P)H-hydrate dehydratase [Blastocatellia bacterium]
MQKVLTAAQIREVDRRTIEEFGIPSIVLMETAAHTVVVEIKERLGPVIAGRSILVLCGKGNNGGDGAAIARLLWKDGANVEALLFGSIDDSSEDAKINFTIIEAISESGAGSGGAANPLRFTQSANVTEFASLDLGKFDICVDALFGTGLTQPLAGEFQQIIDGVNSADMLKISVDLPSGLDADRTAAIGSVINSDVAVTFTAPKLAGVLPPAANHVRELVIAHIGSPTTLIDEQDSQVFVTERQDAVSWLAKSRFASDSYKNKRGHALIIAGSENYSGAAVLCGNAAIRSGVGLVTIATAESGKESVASRVDPEVMVRPVAETDSHAVSAEAIAEIEKFMDNVDAIAIGSGLSASDTSTGEMVRHFVKHRRMPTILDADALTLLSPFEDTPQRQHALILTPHQGEFLKMLGTDDPGTIENRVEAVRSFAQKHGVILILKGERAVIGEPGGRVVINPTGNSGLGKAGNGDTLTGVVAGFVAQGAQLGIDVFDTVVAAVYIAGAAGDLAESKFGKRVMTASDVRDCLAEVFADLEPAE